MTELRNLFITDFTNGYKAEVGANGDLVTSLLDPVNDRVLELESDQSVPVTIKSPLESNGAVPVNIQDQHSQAFDILFEQSTNSTTTLDASSIGDYTIDLTSTTGFVDGTVVIIIAAVGFLGFTQIGAPSGNTITLDGPLPCDVASGSTVRAAISNMNVDGSTTAQSFKIGPIGAISVDVTRFMGYIQSSTAMDDGSFGDQAALTRGVILRKYDDSLGCFIQIWNIKSNGEFGLLCYDTDYTIKPPAGTSHGFRFRNTYAGQSKHGVTIRLDEDDYLEVLIQDDLTGLEIFNIMFQGHLVED